MQTDMHYYGTYAMARAAGLKPDMAFVVATAAEYVDDSDNLQVTLKDGIQINSRATAHHPADRANLNQDDQKYTWVPFHFIPGAVGNTSGEKLICRTDSDVAKQMVKHHLGLFNTPYALQLLGIAAHSYADTFSHYGFTGIASNLNKVKTGSFNLQARDNSILGQVKASSTKFWNKYAGDALNMVMLGHGSVATYPDQPYLIWSFEYEDGRKSGERNNPDTFLRACHLLHQMFSDFGKQQPDYFLSPGAGKSFDDIRGVVSEILNVAGEAPVRIKAWQDAVTAGRLYVNAARTPIPTYDATTFSHDLGLLKNLTKGEAEKTLVYQFIQAAEVHRNYMMNELLPKNGIAF